MVELVDGHERNTINGAVAPVLALQQRRSPHGDEVRSRMTSTHHSIDRP
jgi:hypothetical protein